MPPRPLSLRACCRSAPKAPSQGFTLIEVMVVVAIMAVLATIAAPSFTPLIERWRVRQATEGLESTWYFARSEAIKRGGNVIIQKLPNGTNGCTLSPNNADWGCGWRVCTITTAAGTCNSSGSQQLQRFDTPVNVEVTRTTSGGARIVLNRWGLVAGTFVGFSVVPANKLTTNPAARGLCISSGGRVRVIPPADIPCGAG